MIVIMIASNNNDDKILLIWIQISPSRFHKIPCINLFQQSCIDGVN